MPIFKYDAMDKQGKPVKGETEAADSGSALKKVRDTGLIVLNIEEKSVGKNISFTASLTQKKVTLTDLAIFSKQLSAMLSSGIAITRAISTLSRQTTNKTLAEALGEIVVNVEGGMTLTDAFSQYPKIFSPLYISMIRAGEIGGLLETTLTRLSNQLQKEKKLRDDIKSATSYPKMVGSFAIVIFIGMMVLLVPTFEGFMTDPDKIPALSKFIFSVSDSMRSQPLLWVGAVLLLIILVYSFAKSKAWHDIWENVKFKIPIIGNIIMKSVLARFSRTLATLVEGGISIVQALQTAGPTAGSDLVSKAVNTAIVEIEEGQSIAVPLEQSRLFPPMFTQMIAIGEESGTLSELLNKIAEYYEDDVETSTKSLSAVLEPIVLISIAILVGGMLISLYLPIFSSVVQSGGM